VPISEEQSSIGGETAQNINATNTITSEAVKVARKIGNISVDLH